MAGKQKRQAGALEIRFRLLPKTDQPLINHIKQEARANERKVQQQVRYMLRKAAEVMA